MIFSRTILKCRGARPFQLASIRSRRTAERAMHLVQGVRVGACPRNGAVGSAGGRVFAAAHPLAVVARRACIRMVRSHASKDGAVAAASSDAGDSPSHARMRFTARTKLSFGDKLMLVGSVPELGEWWLPSALNMNWHEGDIWSIDAHLPNRSVVRYKVCPCTPTFIGRQVVAAAQIACSVGPQR